MARVVAAASPGYDDKQSCMGAGVITVGIAELQRVLRIAGEARDLPPGRSRREHALRALCDFIGGRVALWVRAERHRAVGMWIHETLDVGFSDAGERDLLHGYVSDG